MAAIAAIPLFISDCLKSKEFINKKPCRRRRLSVFTGSTCPGHGYLKIVISTSIVFIPLLFSGGIILFVINRTGSGNRNTPELIDPLLFLLGQLPEFPGCIFLDFAHYSPCMIMLNVSADSPLSSYISSAAAL